MTIRTLLENAEKAKEQAETLVETLTEQIDKLEAIEEFALADAIIDQLGSDGAEELFGTLHDVTVGGANAGFGGFIYHTELWEFFQANKTDLVEMLEEQAEEFGVGVLEMVVGFNCLKDCGYTTSDIGKVLYGDDQESSIVDAVCWCALETFAHLADR
jgi:hypothetical protein